MCDEVTPLICEATEHHKLIDLDNVSYFNYVDESDANMGGDRCRQLQASIYEELHLQGCHV